MHSPGTILVVDDDPNDQVMIEHALRHAGTYWDICVLSDGAAAISYLKCEGPYADRTRHPYPTLLITDLKMGPVDGLAVLTYVYGGKQKTALNPRSPPATRHDFVVPGVEFAPRHIGLRGRLGPCLIRLHHAA